jgi:hypothetical protein
MSRNSSSDDDLKILEDLKKRQIVSNQLKISRQSQIQKNQKIGISSSAISESLLELSRQRLTNSSDRKSSSSDIQQLRNSDCLTTPNHTPQTVSAIELEFSPRSINSVAEDEEQKEEISDLLSSSPVFQKKNSEISRESNESSASLTPSASENSGSAKGTPKLERQRKTRKGSWRKGKKPSPTNGVRFNSENSPESGSDNEIKRKGKEEKKSVFSLKELVKRFSIRKMISVLIADVEMSNSPDSAKMILQNLYKLSEELPEDNSGDLRRLQELISIFKCAETSCNCLHGSSPTKSVCLSLLVGSLLRCQASAMLIDAFERLANDENARICVFYLLSLLWLSINSSACHFDCIGDSEERNHHSIQFSKSSAFNNMLHFCCNLLYNTVKRVSNQYIDIILYCITGNYNGLRNKKFNSSVIQPIQNEAIKKGNSKGMIMSQDIQNPKYYQDLSKLLTCTDDETLNRTIQNLSSLFVTNQKNLRCITRESDWYEWIVPLMIRGTNVDEKHDEFAKEALSKEISLKFKLQINLMSMILALEIQEQRDSQMIGNLMHKISDRINQVRQAPGNHIFRVLLFSVIKRHSLIKPAELLHQSDLIFENQTSLLQVIDDFIFFWNCSEQDGLIKFHVSEEFDFPDRILVEEIVLFFREKLGYLEKITQETIVCSQMEFTTNIKARMNQLRKQQDFYENVHSYFTEVRKIGNLEYITDLSKRMAEYLYERKSKLDRKVRRIWKDTIVQGLLNAFENYVSDVKESEVNEFEFERTRSESSFNAHEIIRMRLTSPPLNPRDREFAHRNSTVAEVIQNKLGLNFSERSRAKQRSSIMESADAPSQRPSVFNTLLNIGKSRDASSHLMPVPTKEKTKKLNERRSSH